MRRSVTDESNPAADVSDGYGHQLCQAETPQESRASDLAAAGQQHRGDCKAVVSGLLCGKPVKWEVAFDIEPFLNGREREEKVHEELWNETFHHLAGRSIIHDFEHMAAKESEIEHGESVRRTFHFNPQASLCSNFGLFTWPPFYLIDEHHDVILGSRLSQLHTSDVVSVYM